MNLTDKEQKLFKKICGVLDSEYDVIEHFSKRNLEDYAKSLFPEVTDNIVEQLWITFF